MYNIFIITSQRMISLLLDNLNIKIDHKIENIIFIYLFLLIKRTDYHQLNHNHGYPRRGLAALGG